MVSCESLRERVGHDGIFRGRLDTVVFLRGLPKLILKSLRTLKMSK